MSLKDWADNTNGERERLREQWRKARHVSLTVGELEEMQRRLDDAIAHST